MELTFAYFKNPYSVDPYYHLLLSFLPTQTLCVCLRYLQLGLDTSADVKQSLFVIFICYLQSRNNTFC